MQAQIIPQQIWPPKNPQWANGRIVDTNNASWSVPRDAISMLQQFKGQVINIDFETGVSNQGKPWQKITAVNGTPLQQSRPQPTQGYIAPVPGQAQPPQHGAVATPQTADTKSEEMFVMGVVGRAMGSAKFEITDIPLLAKAATQAWRERTQYQQNGSDPNEPPTPEYDGPSDGWPGPE